MTTTETAAAAVPTEAQPRPVPQLWAQDPEERLAAATRIANALARVIERQHLYVEIQGRRYVTHEGWLTLGAMAGVFPYVVETKPTLEGDGWEARVEARRADGSPIAAAESECRRDEPNWADRPSYALRSMAQTRGSNKALRLCVGWIMPLAGFEPTPAEEVMDVAPAPAAAGGQAPALEAQPRQALAKATQKNGDPAQRRAFALAKELFPRLDPHYVLTVALNLPGRGEGAIREHWLGKGGTWAQAVHVLRQVKVAADALVQQGWSDAAALGEAAREFDAHGKLTRGELLV